MNTHVNQKTLSRRRPKLAFVLTALVAAGLAVAVVHIAAAPPRREAARLDAIVRTPGISGQTISRQLRKTLTRNPMDAAALRVAGLHEVQAGDMNRGGRLMAAAGSLSHRDIATELWLADNDLRHQRFQQAVVHLDALLRLKPELIKQVSPTMYQLALDPRTANLVFKRLDFNPVWRNQFLADMSHAQAVQPMFAALSHLHEGPHGPTEEEISWYLNRLITDKQYEQALLSWMLLLTPEQLRAVSTVYDGDFDGVAAAKPFNWALEGLTELAPRGDNPADKSLHVLYNTMDAGAAASQLIVLPVGRFQLSGSAFYDAPAARDRLRWSVKCAQDGRELASDARMNTDGAFFQNITVPEDGCSAQWLRLVVSESGRRTNLSAWFDKIRINPIDPVKPRAPHVPA